MKTMPALLSALALLTTAVAAAENPSPYAGGGDRDIKALSAQEADDLRAGRGMGLALAAELNGYPGPRHVLDLAEPLDLSAAQRAAFGSLFSEMQAEARRLGAAILAEEAALDEAFRSGTAGKSDLRERLTSLGALQGALRYAHLRSHMTAKALLEDAQVARYNQLRGYAAGGSAPSHGAHSHNPAKP